MKQPKQLVSRTGLSLIELLIAVSMMSILIVTAFMSWGSYIDEARLVSTKNRMDTIRKALETWRADHQRPYPDYSIRPLLGRYLPSDEEDGWGNDFIIDPYFLRVFSRGANGILDSSIPGHGESVSGMNGGDDLVAAAQENGRLVLLLGGSLTVVKPDGSYMGGIAGGVTGGDVASGGGVYVYTDGTKFFREYVTEANVAGTYDPSTDTTSEPVEMTWITDPPIPAGPGWGTVSLSPDGVHLATLRQEGGRNRLYVGEISGPVFGAGASTYEVINFPVGGPLSSNQFTDIAWTRDGGSIDLVGSGTNLYVLRVNSAPGSRLTTPSWGKVAGVNVMSVDHCATRDRSVTVRDGVTTISAGPGAIVASATISGGGADALARFNRQGDAVAIVGTDLSVWIWWPDRLSEPGNPYMVFAPGELGAISGLRWR
jgi:type II secretory pathway pseudopilin PulG